jgi:hypothetical protein
MKKCSNRLIFHILGCHLQIDSVPDPDTPYTLMRIRFLPLNVMRTGSKHTRFILCFCYIFDSFFTAGGDRHSKASGHSKILPASLPLLSDPLQPFCHHRYPITSMLHPMRLSLFQELSSRHLRSSLLFIVF